MPISRLVVLRNVLSQVKDEIRYSLGVSDADAMVRIEHFVRENARKWREDDPAIDYADPFCRLAYLYRNVPVHAALIERSLGQFPATGALIRTCKTAGVPLRVLVLGGGPGSELIGLVRFVQSMQLPGGPLSIDMTLLDRVREWDESWHALKQGIDQRLANETGGGHATWPVVIDRSFLPLDLTSPAEFGSFATRFAGVQLVLVSYAVSELLAKTDDLQRVLAVLCQRIRGDALFLFIDRDEAPVRAAVRKLIEQEARLELTGEHREIGQLDDDVRDFGEWYMGMESLPRRSWRSFFTLAMHRESKDSADNAR